MTPFWGTFSAGAARGFGRGFVPAAGGGVGGKLFAWGLNNYGQLGQGNTTSYSSPVQVGTDTIYSKVSADYFSSYAIKTNGTMFGVGYNGYGSLGVGDSTNRSSPVQIGAATTWQNLAELGNDDGNANWLQAISSAGGRWVSGYNGNGNLGTGNTSTQSTISQPYTDSPGWSVIAQGSFHSMGIKTNGTLWGWGYNGYGQLGTSNTSTYYSPIQIGAGTNWSKVSCGYNTTFAIKTDGTIWSWGDGGNGLGIPGLGFDTTYTYSCYICTFNCGPPYYDCCGGYVGTCSGYNNYSSPTQIGALTNWADVSAGYGHVLARKTNGTLWGWGYNAYGQLGTSNTSNYTNSPVQIGALTNWSKVSGGLYHSLFTKTDGTLWATGYNYYGQLGYNTTIQYTSPIQIGSGTGWTEISAGGLSSFGISTT